MCSSDLDTFTVAVIPHTAAVTTLGSKGPGAGVNLEVDVIAKYTERLLAGQLAGVVVLALLPVAYPTYVGIFLITGAFRLVAAATADVGDDWNTATRIHHGEEAPAEAAFESQR